MYCVCIQCLTGQSHEDFYMYGYITFQEKSKLQL